MANGTATLKSIVEHFESLPDPTHTQPATLAGRRARHIRVRRDRRLLGPPVDCALGQSKRRLAAASAGADQWHSIAGLHSPHSFHAPA